MRQRTRFRKDRSNRCRDVAIFVIFKMAAAAILNFQNSKFLRSIRCRRPICVIVPNFIKIGQNGCRDMAIKLFSKWRPSAILDLLSADWDHPRRVLDGLYHCAKFGLNRCISFDKMKLSIFCPFGLKTPIHAPKIAVFGGYFTPKMGSNVNETPKRHILARIRVV